MLIEIPDSFSAANRTAAGEFIVNLRSNANVLIARTTPDLFEFGLDLYRSRRDKTWGLTDCISFLVMREHGLTDALTADDHFAQAGFRAVLKANA